MIPHATIAARANHVPHVNGSKLILNDTVRGEAGVRDVKAALARAVWAWSWGQIVDGSTSPLRGMSSASAAKEPGPIGAP